MRIHFAIIATVFVGSLASADEGMWTLDNFPVDRVKKKYSAEISEDWLTNVQSSVARMDSGCSASFV